jgi:prepilin-type N-terminal cleavage/methylation domain-containing protein
MKRSTRTRKDGFSLLEVVIVVAIIAILAAIGIPRMSRGSRGANDSAVSGNLAVLRNAIDLFAAEHGGAFPGADTIATQLTQYTNVAGATSETKTETHIYGPYLRSIPPLPVGIRRGSVGIAAEDDVGVGWIYIEASGTITANTTADEKDETKKLYSDY